MRNWLLPEYIEDVLPSGALRIEKMRRRVLDLLLVHGYHYVIPPLLEYVESLLSGSGSDMDLRMFKVLDQLSGRMMGIRADITPQTARIDAHLLNAKGVTRLCYASSIKASRVCRSNRLSSPVDSNSFNAAVSLVCKTLYKSTSNSGSTPVSLIKLRKMAT